MKRKWIKTFEDNFILILERFNNNVHIEFFKPMTVYYSNTEPRTEFFLDSASYNVKFDFDEIFTHIKSYFTINKVIITNEIELKDFIMDFMENNNY